MNICDKMKKVILDRYKDRGIMMDSSIRIREIEADYQLVSHYTEDESLR